MKELLIIYWPLLFFLITLAAVVLYSVHKLNSIPKWQRVMFYVNDFYYTVGDDDVYEKEKELIYNLQTKYDLTEREADEVIAHYDDAAWLRQTIRE